MNQKELQSSEDLIQRANEYIEQMKQQGWNTDNPEVIAYQAFIAGITSKAEVVDG